MFPLYDENPTKRWPLITIVLIVINTGLFIWLFSLPEDKQFREIVEHGFVPARIAQLSDPKLNVEVSINDDPEFGGDVPGGDNQADNKIVLPPDPPAILSSLFSTMFLHGGWLHLLGNMWFLWVFGNNVEDRLGSLLYLLFYLVGGLLATACHWAYDPHSTQPVIGASGAVAAVLGAYAITFPTAKVKTLIFLGIILLLDIPAYVWLAIWFAVELFTALFIGRDLGVAVWAHVGGFAAGLVLMPLMTFGAPPPGSSWEDEVRKHFSFPTSGTQ